MKPSPEQLAQIRRFSGVVYGDPDAVYDHHPEPETREEASDLLKTLNETPAQPRREPMPVRTCEECQTEKPQSAFRKAGRGFRKVCKECEAGADTVTAPPDVQGTDGPGDETAPEAPKNEGHWCLAELRDPRLSTLEAIVQILDQNIGVYLVDEFEAFTLDHAAHVATSLADLDLSGVDLA